MGVRVREPRGGVNSRQRLGGLGERLALVYYVLHGYWPVTRPRHEAVQTDLIMQRGTTLVLIEVKTRRYPVRLEKALGHTQRQRLARQVAVWAARFPSYGVRLDVVIITARWPLVRVYKHVLE
jgi:Holliday junction resolvase-like predicted endonuclease